MRLITGVLYVQHIWWSILLVDLGGGRLVSNIFFGGGGSNFIFDWFKLFGDETFFSLFLQKQNDKKLWGLYKHEYIEYIKAWKWRANTLIYLKPFYGDCRSLYQCVCIQIRHSWNHHIICSVRCNFCPNQGETSSFVV